MYIWHFFRFKPTQHEEPFETEAGELITKLWHITPFGSMMDLPHKIRRCFSETRSWRFYSEDMTLPV